MGDRTEGIADPAVIQQFYPNVSEQTLKIFQKTRILKVETNSTLTTIRLSVPVISRVSTLPNPNC